MGILYIVMPAYNEEDNIETTVHQWYPLLKGKDIRSRLVIADNGSTDRTHAILLKLKEKYVQLEILENTEKQHGPKVIALYDYAIKKGADYIFQTDSDGQTNPEEFEKFWVKRNEKDAIIGVRTIRGDGQVRAFVEKVVCILLYLYFRVRVRDANAPFRLMKTAIVEKYLYRLKRDYNLPNIMMTAFFVYYKENVCFEEISFQSRRGGKNSINIVKIIKIGWNALEEFHLLRKEM